MAAKRREGGEEVAALILAAGASRRMGGHDKIYAPLGGRPLVFYSLRLFEETPEVSGVVAVTAPGGESKLRQLADQYGCQKVRGIVAGGEERRDSAANGLLSAQHFFASDAAILIHDAARPFARPDTIRRLVQALAEADGAVPAVAVPDTIKKVAPEGGEVLATLPREELRAIQTPQAFRLGAIAEAYRTAVRERWPVTDDAAVLERAGGRVVTVEGDVNNFKVTYAEDLARAEAVLAAEAAA
ncbi:MAG: 2-C-methyl-D-erythritol 4-phosphate cytidylyltransferase [Candidatus Coatesbacteria bacterium]|nr:MAG: 2-C-methyl-D-erythritol 4-phosphate cytidylyltransferase [Candidatus Coatesbacteria bacterium]